MQREKAPSFQMKPLRYPRFFSMVCAVIFLFIYVMGIPYPTRCRLSSRILSAIIAMNSELVGFPRRL